MRKTFSWIKVFLWLGVIYYFSSQPDLKSGLETVWDTLLRKMAHLSEFFVLTYFIYIALIETYSGLKWNLFFAGILSFLTAGFDEYHQTFTPGRHGSAFDVIVDSTGIITCLILIIMTQDKRRKERSL